MRVSRPMAFCYYKTRAHCKRKGSFVPMRRLKKVPDVLLYQHPLDIENCGGYFEYAKYNLLDISYKLDLVQKTAVTAADLSKKQPSGLRSRGKQGLG